MFFEELLHSDHDHIYLTLQIVHEQDRHRGRRFEDRQSNLEDTGWMASA